MIEHYNAFISYKHAPEDNKVAEAVHKGLEPAGCFANTVERRVCSISNTLQHVLQHLKLGLIIREEYGIK